MQTTSGTALSCAALMPMTLPGERHRQRGARGVQERAGEVGEHVRAVQRRALVGGERVVQIRADGLPRADADDGRVMSGKRANAAAVSGWRRTTSTLAGSDTNIGA